MNLRVEGNEITFWLCVKPRSPRERFTLDSSGELHLGIHAVPTRNQANEACIEFLARALRVPKYSISIMRGGKLKRKLIRIVAPGTDLIVSKLQALLENKETRS